MPTAIQYVKYMLPTLYADVEQCEFFLDEARTDLDSSYYGSRYEKAVALLAMHNYTLVVDPARQNGEAGLVTAKSEGNASVHFYNKTKDEGSTDWSITKYGRQLLALTKSICPAMSSSSAAIVSDLLYDNEDY